MGLGFNVEIRQSWQSMGVQAGDIAIMEKLDSNIATLSNENWKYKTLPFYLNEFVVLDQYKLSFRYRLRMLADEQKKSYRSLSLNAGFTSRYFSEMISRGRYNRRGDMSLEMFERLREIFGL